MRKVEYLEEFDCEQSATEMSKWLKVKSNKGRKAKQIKKKEPQENK